MCKFVNNAKYGRIDECMINLLALLKTTNHKVISCCCGHRKFKERREGK